MPTRIIIDTDPGQDDAIAILLALASPELEVLGITAVAGNVPLPLTATNCLKVCELAGRADVPVFAGADRPLVRPLITAEYAHGKTGLDGPDLPAPTMRLRDGHSVDFIVETLLVQVWWPENALTLYKSEKNPRVGPIQSDPFLLQRSASRGQRARRGMRRASSGFSAGRAKRSRSRCSCTPRVSTPPSRVRTIERE